jgi:hypothetical protein
VKEKFRAPFDINRDSEYLNVFYQTKMGLRMEKLKYIVFLGMVLAACFAMARAQDNPNFRISLSMDFYSAEYLLDYLDFKTNSTMAIAGFRGNQIAAATSVMLGRTARSGDDFENELQRVRSNTRITNDLYGLLPAKEHSVDIRKLLTEVKRRRLDRRVLGTIAEYFPADTKIISDIPVYIVAMGNERAAAVVRRVEWDGNVPKFVGEGEGQPVVILNLARCLQMAPVIDEQFLEMLATLAHECFHAAFSVLKQSWPESLKPATADGMLQDIVQNEGIAYHISMQIHLDEGRRIPQQWFDGTTQAIAVLNRTMLELRSPRLSQSRAQELLMNANLSGSFEGNYGATAGMRMAYEIDRVLGRPALTATLNGGGGAFFLAYREACRRDPSLPAIDGRIMEWIQKQ